MKGGEYQVSKIQKIINYGTSFVALAAVSPISSVIAQDDSVNIIADDVQFQRLNNLKPSDFVSGLINLMLGVAGVIAFIFLLWGGLQWILAGGDKEGTEKARKKITSALIGLSIVFSAYALLFIIKALFNIDAISVNLSSLGGI